MKTYVFDDKGRRSFRRGSEEDRGGGKRKSRRGTPIKDPKEIRRWMKEEGEPMATWNNPPLTAVTDDVVRARAQVLECLRDIAPDVPVKTLIDRLCEVQGFLRNGVHE